MKNITGYIYKFYSARKSYTLVFRSLAELRLYCGKIPLRDIEKVQIVKIHEKYSSENKA